MQNLGNQAEFTLDLGNRESTYFKVLAGTQEFLAEQFADLDLPKAFALLPAYPNPFNPVTRVQFHVPYFVQTPDVHVEIMDCNGKLIASLFEGGKPGYHSLLWSAKDRHGKPVSTGVYFVRMRAMVNGKNAFHASRKLTLMK